VGATACYLRSDAVYFGKQILSFGLQYLLHFTVSSLSTNTVCTITLRHLHGLAYRVQSQSQNFKFNSLYIFFYLRTAFRQSGDRQVFCTLKYNT